MMRDRTFAAALLCCAALLTACDQAKPSEETFVWKGPVKADSWLRLRNVSGDFEVSEAPGDSAEIQLVIDRSSAYAPAARIKVLQTQDGILACALYGEDNSCSATEYKGGNTTKSGFLPFMRGRTTVTGTIRLPRGVKLDAQSTNGDITVTAVASDVTAETTNGDIVIRGSRSMVNANTTNGDIELAPDAMGSKFSVGTTNGDVSVDLPAAFSAAVNMRTTNGDLDLGLPGNITTKTAKLIIATLGTGGSPIDIQTTNGDITLRARGTP
jgi:Putative adhesin